MQFHAMICHDVPRLGVRQDALIHSSEPAGFCHCMSQGIWLLGTMGHGSVGTVWYNMVQ